MKIVSMLTFAGMLALGGCKTDSAVTPTTPTTPTRPDYQIAIEDKFKALGWDKDGHSPFNGGGIVKTQGGNGYVQYYAFGGNKTAIYYFTGKEAFSMNTVEMNTYDAAGQDKFAYLVSDTKSCGTGCGYNDIIKISDSSEGIILYTALIYGEIYKKYKQVNRWDGPMGLPTSSVMPTPATATDKGSFVTFKKGTVEGGIWNTPTVGTQAVWGKVYQMWVKIDWERSWLKFPTSSCDPSISGDNGQGASFQGGAVRVSATGCGNYYSPAGGLRDISNNIPSSGASLCY